MLTDFHKGFFLSRSGDDTPFSFTLYFFHQCNRNFGNCLYCVCLSCSPWRRDKNFWSLDVCIRWLDNCPFTLFLVDNIPQASVFLRLEWLFQVLVPPLYLLFSIHYKDYRRWLLGWRQIIIVYFSNHSCFFKFIKTQQP